MEQIGAQPGNEESWAYLCESCCWKKSVQSALLLTKQGIVHEVLNQE